MKASTATITITPRDSMFLVGPLAPSTGVQDDLYARVLVLEDGATCIAIVALDLIGFDASWGDRMQQAVRQCTGLPDLKVMLCYSHTHSAPRTINWSIAQWEEAQGALNPWLDELPKRVGGLVATAVAALSPARLSHGRAHVQVGMNRRLPGPDGIHMAPNPEGAVVPWTDVLVAKNLAGEPLGVLYSHAAHPVIVHGTSTLISADYPGYAAEEIQRRLGEQVVPLFALGCAGDCNGDPLRGGFEAARVAGRTLAAAVAEAVESAQPLPDAPLHWLTSETALPFRTPPPRSEIEAMLEGTRLSDLDLEKSSDAATKRWYVESARSYLEEILSWPDDRDPGALTFRLAGFAVGDAFALVGLNHEPFAAYQLAAEEASPFPHTMVVGYVNCVEGYIPTEEALVTGGYETSPLPTPGAPLRYAHRLNLAPGIEALVSANLHTFLHRLAATNHDHQVLT